MTDLGYSDDHIHSVLEMDASTTALLLSEEANKGFNTQPVHILMSAVWHAFFTTFSERSDLTIWNESHGREPWNNDIDISRTVSWFTTASPTHIKRGLSHSHRYVQSTRYRAVAQAVVVLLRLLRGLRI